MPTCHHYRGICKSEWQDGRPRKYYGSAFPQTDLRGSVDVSNLMFLSQPKGFQNVLLTQHIIITSFKSYFLNLNPLQKCLLYIQFVAKRWTFKSLTKIDKLRDEIQMNRSYYKTPWTKGKVRLLLCSHNLTITLDHVAVLMDLGK